MSAMAHYATGTLTQETGMADKEPRTARASVSVSARALARLNFIAKSAALHGQGNGSISDLVAGIIDDWFDRNPDLVKAADKHIDKIKK